MCSTAKKNACVNCSPTLTQGLNSVSSSRVVGGGSVTIFRSASLNARQEARVYLSGFGFLIARRWHEDIEMWVWSGMWRKEGREGVWSAPWLRQAVCPPIEILPRHFWLSSSGSAFPRWFRWSAEIKKHRRVSPLVRFQDLTSRLAFGSTAAEKWKRSRLGSIRSFISWRLSLERSQGALLVLVVGEKAVFLTLSPLLHLPEWHRGRLSAPHVQLEVTERQTCTHSTSQWHSDTKLDREAYVNASIFTLSNPPAPPNTFITSHSHSSTHHVLGLRRLPPPRGRCASAVINSARPKVTHSGSLYYNITAQMTAPACQTGRQRRGASGACRPWRFPTLDPHWEVEVPYPPPPRSEPALFIGFFWLVCFSHNDAQNIITAFVQWLEWDFKSDVDEKKKLPGTAWLVSFL